MEGSREPIERLSFRPTGHEAYEGTLVNKQNKFKRRNPVNPLCECFAFFPACYLSSSFLFPASIFCFASFFIHVLLGFVVSF